MAPAAGEVMQGGPEALQVPQLQNFHHELWWKVLRRIPWAINLGFHYPLCIAVFFQVSVRHFIA